jgi:hypothetical protein
MRWVAVSLVCAVAVAGCGLPVVAGEPSKPVVTTKTPSARKAPVLSAAQAKRALLTLNDMPTGSKVWPGKGEGEADGDDGTVTPKRCQALLGKVDDGKPVAKAKAAFSSDANLLEESVTSYSTPQAAALNRLAYAFRQCPKFTSTEKDGTSMTFRASSLSFPKLGDRTVALRLKFRTSGVTAVLDVVCIAKGNNGILLTAGGLHPLDSATLEKLARKSVARLDLVDG